MNFNLSILGIILLCLNFHSLAWPDEITDRRVRTGIKLFRTVLAADLDITKKKTANNKLLLAIVYSDNQYKTKKFAEELGRSKRGKKTAAIKRIPIEVAITNNISLESLEKINPAGIYISDKISDLQLKTLVDYSIQHQIIVYSPFEDHVRKGILGGLIIEANISPYININTLKTSKIRIKPFFLKIAKHYEP